jgi:hypothetical protein
MTAWLLAAGALLLCALAAAVRVDTAPTPTVERVPARDR